MSALQILILILAILIIIGGLIGVFIPVLPGIPLIFAGILLYAAFTKFQIISLTTVLIFLIVTLLSLFFDWAGSLLGAKKFGASPWAILGAFLGVICGLILAGPLGLILGAIVGAIIFELIYQKKFSQSIKSGLGALVGFILSIFFNFILAILMIIFFLRKVI